MEQRSPEWYRLRASKIGASDAPTILGTSPWQTRYELWSTKTGRKVSDFKTNFAIERGIRWEDAARAKYELLTGLELPPVVVVSDEHPWMMASLDGYCAEKGIVLEIKIPGREVFEAAKQGVVHEKYKAQVHHQRLVTKATEVHFWCCKVESVNGVEQITDTALVVVKPDRDFERELMIQLVSFWDFVSKDLAPPLTERDTMHLDDQNSVAAAANFLKAKKELDEEIQAKELQDEKVKEKKQQLEEARGCLIEHFEAHGHNRNECLAVVGVKTKTGSWMIKVSDAAEKHQAEK